MLTSLLLLYLLPKAYHSNLLETEFEIRDSLPYESFPLSDIVSYINVYEAYVCAFLCLAEIRCEWFSFSESQTACIGFLDMRNGTYDMSYLNDQGYKHFLQVFPSIYYYNSAKSWNQAHDDCEDYGKSLAVLKTPELMDFATTYITKINDQRFDGYFIGLSMLNGPPVVTFKWTDGTAVTNTADLPWDTIEPNNLASEHCVIIYRTSLKLRTRDCNTPLPFFCTAET